MTASPSPHLPSELGPGEGEAGVLSLLAVGAEQGWTVAAGSLLAMPWSVATTSWPQWAALQPRGRRRDETDGFDLGPLFWAEPFPRIRMIRSILSPRDWHAAMAAVQDDGCVPTPFGPCTLPAKAWTSTLQLNQDGTTDAHHVLLAARRPVTAVVAALEPPPMPPSEDTWAWPVPPGMPRRRDFAAISSARRLLHWPKVLLGIDWVGTDAHDVPPAFVVGRTLHEAWIADLRPDFETGELVTSIAWDEHRIDALACTLLIRNEADGIPALVRHVRISDLPIRGVPETEPRSTNWSRRTLDVAVPHGPRDSDWGVALLSPDGRLLDERPAVRRVTSVTFSLGFGGAASTFTVGDRGGPPTAADRDEAVRAAQELEREARAAAAARRMSTSGEVADYLRWRFSCRDGEMLIADPWLFGDDPEATVAFLRALARPVRGLAGGLPQRSEECLTAARAAGIDIRPLPGGRKALHDRVWLVGETGLLVGTSLNALMVQEPGGPRATSTTELPHADALVWRDQFEAWWSATKAPAPAPAGARTTPGR